MLPNNIKSIILSQNKKTDFSQNKSKKYKYSKISYPKKITKAILHDLLSNMSNKEESSNRNENKIFRRRE